MFPELVTGPTTEPVSASEAKSHLRVTTSADDTFIGTLIVAARQAAEKHTNRSFIDQTWQVFLDEWPQGGMGWWDGVRQGSILSYQNPEIRLPLGPVLSVTSITTYDEADVGTVFSSTKYFVDTGKARIVLRTGESWPLPTRRYSGIKILWKSGWTNAAAVPQGIKQAMLVHIAAMYERRGDELTEVSLPALGRTILDQYRWIAL